MFTCFNPAGSQITTALIADCDPASYITMTASEFANLANKIDTAVSVSDLLSIPSPDVLSMMFLMGLKYPLIAYLTMWSFGQLLKMIEGK